MVGSEIIARGSGILTRIIFLLIWFLICFYSTTLLISVYVPLDNGIELDDLR